MSQPYYGRTLQRVYYALLSHPAEIYKILDVTWLKDTHTAISDRLEIEALPYDYSVWSEWVENILRVNRG